MAEMNVPKYSQRKRIWQPSSVPYLWEVRPGIAKDWKPTPAAAHSVPALPPPVKLTASVPFNLEEKPEMPLPNYPQPVQDLTTTPALLGPLPLPPVLSRSFDEQETISSLDLEEFVFESDGSFSSAVSAASLLANCLMSSAAISAAIPQHKTSMEDDAGRQLETMSSPASETDSMTSSYATGTSRPVGAAFLECLFPLLPPSSLQKVCCLEKKTQVQPSIASKHLNYESTTCDTAGRAPTLGELIMMSRRSYQKKAVQMRQQNLSMKLMKQRALGCGIFKSTIHMAGGLHRKKCPWALNPM